MQGDDAVELHGEGALGAGAHGPYTQSRPNCLLERDADTLKGDDAVELRGENASGPIVAEK